MIDDIIRLKTRLNLLEEDATPEKQKEWYEFCLRHRLLEYEYSDGKLVGFLEYVRLNKIPKDMNSIKIDYGTIKTAPILFVSNCCVIGKGIIWRLKKKLFEHNKNFTSLCWHRKKRNDFVVFKRRVANEISLSL